MGLCGSRQSIGSPSPITSSVYSNLNRALCQRHDKVEGANECVMSQYRISLVTFLAPTQLREMAYTAYLLLKSPFGESMAVSFWTFILNPWGKVA